MRGFLIALAGIDGAGKSSHLQALTSWLSERGRQVVVTREPGGTDLAEHLRGLVLGTPMDGVTEALLVFAARRDHWRAVIAPSLTAGFTVLTDRFVDCSFAFQGGGRGVSWNILEQLEIAVLGGVRPDLTIVFDLPPRQAAQRRGSRQAADRFESEEEDFHSRVRAGYRRRIDEDPTRFLVIDASQPREAVLADVLEGLVARGL